MRRLLPAVLLTTTLGCAGRSLHTACDGDEDCPPGYRCVPSGVCTANADALTDSGAGDAALIDGRLGDAAATDVLPHDLGHTDAALPEVSPLDGTPDDAGSPDRTLPDAPRADARRPDTPQVDSRLPDSWQPDTQRPDTAVADTTAPDRATALPYQLTFDGAPIACGERRSIDIEGSQVPGPLSGFPLLIDSTVQSALQDDLRNAVSGGAVFNLNGYDILFAHGDDQEALAHELERYNLSTGELLAWVRVDLTGLDQTLYLYFGCPGIEAETERPAAVWDSDFIGVWHMSPQQGFTLDSTGNGWDATNSGATFVADGWIDGAFAFARSEDDALVMEGTGNSLNLDAFTAEAWLYTPDANVAGDYYVVSQGLYCDNDEAWMIGICDDSNHSGDARFTTVEHGNQQIVYGPRLTDGAWHHLAGVRTDTQLQIYVDGALASSRYDSRVTQSIRSSSDLAVGTDPCAAAEAFNGRADEVRLSRTARSAGWIEASHNNQRDPGSFYTVGP